MVESFHRTKQIYLSVSSFLCLQLLHCHLSPCPIQALLGLEYFTQSAVQGDTASASPESLLQFRISGPVPDLLNPILLFNKSSRLLVCTLYFKSCDLGETWECTFSEAFSKSGVMPANTTSQCKNYKWRLPSPTPHIITCKKILYMMGRAVELKPGWLNRESQLHKRK